MNHFIKKCRKDLSLMFLLMFSMLFVACGDDDNDDGSPSSRTTAEAIDLGLPSGTLWASCNVGANSPEEYGSYFAWGETEEKGYYDVTSYKWYDDPTDNLTKYCTVSDKGTVDNKTALDPADDVAHVKWGGKWRMPTDEEIEELVEKCSSEWTMLNGVRGYKFTGPNGNSIFLPAAGYRNWNGDLIDPEVYGSYWSSMLYDDDEHPELACTLDFYKYPLLEKGDREEGMTVRPVRSK